MRCMSLLMPDAPAARDGSDLCLQTVEGERARRQDRATSALLSEQCQVHLGAAQTWHLCLCFSSEEPRSSLGTQSDCTTLQTTSGNAAPS